MLVLVYAEVHWFYQNLIKDENDYAQVTNIQEATTINYTIMEIFLDIWLVSYIA